METDAEYVELQKQNPVYASIAKMGIACKAFHNYRMESPIFRLYWNFKQWRKNVFNKNTKV